jgi:hypothetical protein
VLEDRPVAGFESCERVAQQILLPVADRSDAIDEDESTNGLLIAFGREHREPAAPRVAKHIPLRESDRFAQRGEIAGIVLDASGARTGWCLRRAASALVVEDQLATLRERRQRGPQQIVIEEEPAVHAGKRNSAGHFWGEVHGELEPACTNGAPSQARRSGARASKCNEALSRGDGSVGYGRDKIVMYITSATVSSLVVRPYVRSSEAERSFPSGLTSIARASET